MRSADLLSDTVYREQACRQLDDLLQDRQRFPVEKSQLDGLRQIARQQPGRVKEFAGHQRERAERKLESVSRRSERQRANLQAEIDFWLLVGRLCDSTSDWSVHRAGLEHAPTELREENIPPKRAGMTPAERTHRNQLKRRRQEWIEQWTSEHIPAFFERFCTHALYRRETPLAGGPVTKEP